MINGYYGAETTGILGHELGHNMGLLHANVIDPRTTASQSSAEYGDATDTMGSGSQDVPISADGGTYNPSEFNVGYKDALNWVPAGASMDGCVHSRQFIFTCGQLQLRGFRLPV